MWPYNIPEPFRKLSAGTLKSIALVTMLIDHAAIALLMNPVLLPAAPIYRGTRLYDLYLLYRVMRSIGRIAFPIFCFFIAEGFFHTRSRFFYAARLLLLAIISEIPFNLALENGGIFDTTSRNTIFTLLFGLLSCWAFDYFRDKWYIQLPLTAGCFAAAYFLKTDYGWRGALVIFLFYLLHDWRIPQLIAGFIAISFIGGELPFALISLPLLMLYNGKRGRMPGVVFYAFYPVHLIVLRSIARIAFGIPTV